MIMVILYQKKKEKVKPNKVISCYCMLERIISHDGIYHITSNLISKGWFHHISHILCKFYFQLDWLRFTCLWKYTFSPTSLVFHNFLGKFNENTTQQKYKHSWRDRDMWPIYWQKIKLLIANYLYTKFAYHVW